MDERVENTFLTEIFVQCETALIFAGDLKQAVQQKNDPRIWCAVQGLLSCIANVSKMLWPLNNAQTASKGRGERLRLILSVSDIAILKDKKFRNHFEHFDERLDKWAEGQESAPKPLLDGWITYSKANFVVNRESLLRVFDATDLTVLFYGEKYPLEPVIEAINKLQTRVHTVARARLDEKKRALLTAHTRHPDSEDIG